MVGDFNPCKTPAKSCYVSTYPKCIARLWFGASSLFTGDIGLLVLAGECLIRKGNFRTYPVRTTLRKSYDQGESYYHL